jgi:hypothetical protein
MSAVFGLYSTPTSLESAVEVLRANGFRSADISVLSAQHPRPPVVTPENEASTLPSAGPSTVDAVGGALGWLVGLGALAMASGVFLVAGPIMEALARMGHTAGGVAAGLAGFGVSEVDAQLYEGRILSGGKLLLSVHTDDGTWFNRGKNILEQTGAQEILAVGAPAPVPANS